MFIRTKTIGNKHAILDTDDGILEWVSTQQYQTFLKKGLQIFDAGTPQVPKQMLFVEWSRCKWIQGIDSDIFSAATQVFWNRAVNSKFTVVCGKKKFNGIVIGANTDEDQYKSARITIQFNFNVFVVLPMDVIWNKVF